MIPVTLIKKHIREGDIRNLYLLAAENPGSFFNKMSYRQLGKLHLEKLYLLVKFDNGDKTNSFEGILARYLYKVIYVEQQRLKM